MRRICLLLLLALSATFVATGCGQFGKKYHGDSKTKAAAANEQKITTKKFDAAAKKADGCEDVQEFDSEGRTHTSSLKEKVTYKTNPPTSGNHYQVPAECGVYDKQQPDVQTTHNLEHGHIVIDYKGLTDAQLSTLLKQDDKNSYHLLVQPRDKDPKAGVYYTAWTAMLYCKTPSAPGLQYMIDTYRDQGPELFTTDTGGGNMGGGKKA
jgi:hypothetical protein